MKKLIAIFGVILFLGIGVILAKSNTSQNTSGKLQVAASFYPMYFFASQIGGDKVSVFNITPTSAEPHDYEPTTQDITKIEKANMLVLNGGALEAWGEKIKSELPKSTVVVVAGDNLVTKQLVEEGKTIKDPHVWLDPILAKQEVANIEKGFEKVDPKNSSYYQTNMKSLDAKLDQLNNEYKTGLSNCQQKDFVSSHAAFAYLGAQYGINQIAISGVSPDEEPSSQTLANIANLVKQKNIKVIFFESLVSPKLSDTIANETGAKTLVLDPLEGIPTEEAAKGADYFSIMKQNLANLQIALQCNK